MWALALLLLHHGALFHRVLSRILESYQKYPSLIDIPIPRRNWLMIPHLSCLKFALSGAHIFQYVFPVLRPRTDPHARIARIHLCHIGFSSSEMVRFLARRQTFPTGP
ncbi:hypothetical protein B0H14DRAFT_2695852 [Mycena olivaceomarginata]|nr:hypothetical protein B0H14DRAFT_2779711 [Mycena olivaceomarginata]KAJ7859208.1 hypothetical protein B0H14DRAFT_2747470 [Mycena olivaceomarginata]KAJ7887235.1 hypothetical protein B0H14DRAFT_2695852 [Mycena olivaceomarginata]